MKSEQNIPFLKKTAVELRRNILTIIHNAQSGHPGGSLSAADIITCLYYREPQKMYASGKKGVSSSRGIDCYDVVQAQLEFKNCLVSLESSWIIPRGWRNIIDFRIDDIKLVPIKVKEEVIVKTKGGMKNG